MKRIFGFNFVNLLIRCVFILSLVACSDPLGLSNVPNELQVDVETTSGLDDSTLLRLRELQRTLERGAEIGPETRAMIDRLNETIRLVNEKGLRAEGTIIIDEATLKRIDTLVSIIEDDLDISVGVALDQPTIAMVNRLADSIDAAPGNWETAVTEIIHALENSTSAVGRELAKEVKSVLDKAKLDAQQLSATLGNELRCNVDFMGARMNGSVTEFIGRSIVEQIKALVAGKALPTATKLAKVCQIIPDQIDLTQSGDQLVYNGDPIKVSGYDLTQDNLPEAYIADEVGQRIGTIPLFPLRTSDYQLQLNLQGIDFRLLPMRAKVVFQWANGASNTPSKSEIAVLLPTLPTPTFTPVPEAQLTIGTQTINVRRGPGINYEAIGLAEAGAIFVVTGRNGNLSWWQIQYGNELGWVFGDLVSRNEIPVPVVGDIPLPPTSTSTPIPVDTATNTPEPTATLTNTPIPVDTVTPTLVPPTLTPTPTFTHTPTPVVRHLLLNGAVRLRDDENFGSDERFEGTLAETFILSPPNVATSFSEDWCAGDEVRGELHLQIELINDGAVHVFGRALYFEGTDCQTNDLEKTHDIDMWVGVDQSLPVVIRLGDGDGDVNFDLTLRNIQ